LKNVGAVGVEISAFPLTSHITYTTACCYRTSRDGVSKILLSRVWPFARLMLSARWSCRHRYLRCKKRN